MRSHVFACLIVAFCLLSGDAWATLPSCPTNPVYISSGSQILCVDRAPASLPAQVVVLTTESSAVFEDLAFGPDGQIYASDSLGHSVWRVDPSSGSHAQVAVFPSGGGAPTGLSFSGSAGDLYVNTSTGVWKITGIAVVPPPASLTPVQMISFGPTITSSPPIAAGGNAFDIPGNLVLVDQTDNQVLQAPPPYTSLATSPVTSVSSSGPGIAVNFCGDLLVASGTTITRFSGGTLTTFVNFGSKNVVRYLEVTADNTVLAATFSKAAGGIVWRVRADPVVDPLTHVTSCTAVQSTTPLVALKFVPASVGLLSTIANGVALPPTSLLITHTFAAGTNVTNVYNFGHHSYSVTYKRVIRSFPQTLTAFKTRPADIVFGGSIPTNAVPMHYSSLGGFAVQYITPSATAPKPSTQYVASTPGTHDAIQIKVGYFTQDIVLQPGLGHASGDDLNSTYTDDITHDFWESGLPGIDDANGGLADGWSKYVVFNKPNRDISAEGFTPPPIFILKEPVLSGNPQFKSGQAIRVAFTLTDQKFVTIPNAIARLSIATSDGLTVVKVVSKNNVDEDNLFNFGTSSNLYTYVVDSTGFPTGVLTFAIFSDTFVPQSFNVTIVP